MSGDTREVRSRQVTGWHRTPPVPPAGRPPGRGSGRTDRLYGALSEGGSEASPIADMPWGAYWGVILDRYDIRWTVNHTRHA